VPIWVVRAGNDLFVRSYRGTDGAWYQLPHGRIRAGGVDRDVTFDSAGEDSTSAADDGDTYLRPMLTEQASAATLRLSPRD
jgi:hypothetical protein